MKGKIFILWFLFGIPIYAGINFSGKTSKVILPSGSKLRVGSSISEWNGTLEKKSGGSLEGSSITFNEGIFDDAGVETKLTAVYDPSASKKITLNGSQSFRAASGIVLDGISISGVGNRVEGQPLFNSSDSISLANGNTELTFAIQSDLNSNIELNGGKVKLDNSLRLEDERNLIGSGVVALQGQKFSFGSKELTLTHTIVWDSAGDINLSGRTNLSGTWSFSGSSKLQGHGNILDITNGGTIRIENNTLLEMTDIVIKGLGINKGWFVFIDDTSQIRMSNVTIELDNNFTTTVGGIYVEGPTTFVTKNYDWVFEQYASLTVDGITLWLDPVAQEGSSYMGKIKFGDGDIDKYVDYIDSGTIKTILSSYSIENVESDLRFNSNAIVTLDREVVENSNAIVTLDREVEENSNAIVTLDREVVENSNAIVTLDREVEENSNAIVTLDREVVENSNAIVTLDREVEENSNAIVTLDREVVENSNAIVTLDREVEENSNAIVSHDLRILTNSVAIWNNSKEIQRLWTFILGDFDLPGWWADYELLAAKVAENEIDIVNNSNAIVNLSYYADIPFKQVENLLDAQGFCGFVPLYNFIEGGDQLHYKSDLQSPINPAGSVIEIFNDIRFSSDTTIESSGFLSPHGSAFILGGDLLIPDGIDVHFTTSGIIDGQGHNLIFGRNSKLTLDQYLTLTLRNINLRNLKNHGDGSSSISVKRSRRFQLALQNVDMHFERDFTFSFGQLYIHGDVNICGTNQFNYTSTYAARIDINSMWNFDKNSTFSYAPASDNRNLIVMADKTSTIFLNGTTFKTTTTGLQLTTGTLIMDHKNYIYNDSTRLSGAIAFGDGNSNNDLNIEILPGGSLELMSGILDYKNVS